MNVFDFLSLFAGDTADGWIDVAANLWAPRMPHVKFILPTAVVSPVTLNGGYPMPAWYDIKSLSGDRKSESCDGIQASRDRILKIIAKEEEKSGIKPERIVLGGFSQGAAMSYYTGLTFPHKFAGLLILSGYMPIESQIKPTEEAKKTPIFACHGDADGVVQLAWGKDGVEQAKAKGVADVTFKVYEDLPHSADPDELEDALKFLQKVLP
jgi:predicted esterase